MQAMLLTAPGRFSAHSQPMPDPEPYQLLVRTAACGLCASELDVFLGRNPWQQYPALLGHEGVGRVVALGAQVTGWHEGDLVAAAGATGCFAELFAIDASLAVPVPDNLPPHLALAEPLACAVNALSQLGMRPNDRVVVLGAGFMGLVLVQLLQGMSPQWLLVAARRAEARRLAEELGATEACPPELIQQRVWERTAGEGADVVVEATGAEPMLAIAASMLRPEGTLAIVGYHQGEGRRVPIHEWNWKALRIANCHVRSSARLADGARRGLALAASGALDMRRLVTHQFPLSAIQQAFEAAASRPPGFVKAVIVPG